MPNQEFFQAAEAYAKKARRVAVGLTIERVDRSYTNFTQQWRGHSSPQVPFYPRWMLIEPVKGMVIHDVKYGSESQLLNCDPIPLSLYSMDEALSLLESPDSPAWDRFKLEPRDGRPLDVGRVITVELGEVEEVQTKGGVIRCVFIGDEPHFRPWEGNISGTVRAVAMTENGPIVEVNVPYTGVVKIPIKPVDIPTLTEKLGHPVKFHFSTES